MYLLLCCPASTLPAFPVPACPCQHLPAFLPSQHLPWKRLSIFMSGRYHMGVIPVQVPVLLLLLLLLPAFVMLRPP